jgi:hypothetical protein
MVAANVSFGKKTWAQPNGKKAGVPLRHNLRGAAYGWEGPTAAIKPTRRTCWTTNKRFVMISSSRLTGLDGALRRRGKMKQQEIQPAEERTLYDVQRLAFTVRAEKV